MPLVTRIRHLAAFALVEANNRLFIDGQAHTPNNLAPIAFDKLGAISAISTQEKTFMGDPLFSLPRATWIQPTSIASSTVPNNVFFDSTITLCGKNIGSPGVRYDSVNQHYYVGNKTTQNTSGTAWSTKIYDKNFDLLYSGAMPVAGDSDRGQSVIFLNPKVDNAQVCVTQQLSAYSTSAPSNTSKVIKFDSSLSSDPSTIVSVRPTQANPNAVGPTMQTNGWFQVVHQDANNAGAYTILVDSTLDFSGTRANFNNAYAIDRTTNRAIALGTTSPRTDSALSADVVNGSGVVTQEGADYLFSDTYGCLASNAEYMSQSGSGNDPIFFYTMRTVAASSTGPYRHQITVCKVDQMSTALPVLSTTACTYSPANFTFLNDITSRTRRFRLFIFRDTASGLDYLGIIGYEPANNATSPMAQGAQNLYVFRIGGANNNELTYISEWKVPLGNFGAVRGAMPMDSTMKKWLVCYTDKFSIYQWNSSTGFTQQSTQNIQPSWVGVDSLGRLWVAESETLSLIFGDGQKLYYFPSSGTAIALQASFQASSYTFSGTPINSNIVINAYDLTGARTSVDVLVNLEGSNVTFADGSTRKTLTTSSSADTLVPIIVKSTGLLRATIMEAV